MRPVILSQAKDLPASQETLPVAPRNQALGMNVAIILAAGESRRMGRPKQLLPFADKTMLESLTLKHFYGEHADDIERLVVEDEGVLVDIDDRETYERELKKLQ